MSKRIQNAASPKLNGLLALIPARSGSQRIPQKNIRAFFGHPMIAYAIAAAQNSGLFQRLVVSSDSAEIGRIANWYGAEFLQRPPELAKDSVGVKDVALHALKALASRDGFSPEALCQLMPNCPLRRSEDIAAHYKLFQQGRRDFQISVV